MTAAQEKAGVVAVEMYGQLPIRETRPEWLHGLVRATVTIGSNHYSRDAATFHDAAQALRDELPPFFAKAVKP